ncbi:GNAT family N-acetyltransferase, partial [Pseudoduganella buxea]
MIDTPFTIEELHGDGVRFHAAALADVLHDCVCNGASVGFLPPFGLADARRFWLGVAQQVDSGARTVFVARDADGVCGTVQLALATPANGAHRAEVNKMLVHTRARRRGIARQLMLAAEARARELGRRLLVLDTWTGSGAQHLYEQLGFEVSGIIPAFARLDDGSLGATTVMYKLLAPRLAVADADPASPEAAGLLAELSARLAALTGDDGTASFDAAAVRGP